MFEVGKVFTVLTYAEFLNVAFGKNYKRWCKSTFEYDDDTTIWMIKIDSKERDGYYNYMDGKCIVEKSSTKPTRSMKPIRMVFQIVEANGYKNFIYKGKYTLDENKSTAICRYFKPIE